MAEGFLGQQYFAVISMPAASPEEMKAVLPRHLDYQVSLEQQGIMFAAGPLESEDGSRRGLIVIRAGSFDEARKIADADPMHSEGVRTYSVERWTVNEGSYTVRVTYSDQKMTIE